MQRPLEFEGRIAEGKDWREIVAWVGDLPPLPQIAQRAMVMADDPNVNVNGLTKLLGQDTALAARILKISNSAMFACQKEITTINQAIIVIGFRELKGVILAAALRQLNRKQGELENMIWQNSTCTALATRTLCKRLKKQYVDEAFLIGLLHDLGKLVLVGQLPKEYLKVQERTKQGVTYFEAEQEILGFAHPLIGALVAKKWNFSSETYQVILHHHDTMPDQFEAEIDERTAIVQAADLISHSLGYGHSEGYPDLGDKTYSLATKLGLDEQSTNEIFVEVEKAFIEQSGVFS